jgi:hypothetical protein
MNHLPHLPENNRIFLKFADIFASQGAPPIATTPVVNFATGTAVFVAPVKNLPSVVHLELRISPRIFEKIRNGPNGILRGLGETAS